jgi:drug/metabolite transporter (DMT)-like permease
VTKLIAILLVGLLCEAAGVVLLSRALKELGEMKSVSVAEAWRLFKAGATHPVLLAGIALEAAFFGALLYLLGKADVSFVWPMTALSFVFTTVAAKLVLKETVTTLRWSGVAFILIGAALITYSEKQKSAATDVSAAAKPDLGR